MDLKAILGASYKDGMTFAEMQEALKDVSMGHSDEEWGKMKKAVDNATHEAADFKKQLREHLSAEEAAEADRKTAAETQAKELDALRHESQVTKLKAKYMGLGYSEELAASTAEAFTSGDTETVFKNAASHQAELLKGAKKASVLSSDKLPPAGSSNTVTDYTKLAADAAKDGRYAEQAYYIRLAQQQENKTE